MNSEAEADDDKNSEDADDFIDPALLEALLRKKKRKSIRSLRAMYKVSDHLTIYMSYMSISLFINSFFLFSYDRKRRVLS